MSGSNTFLTQILFSIYSQVMNSLPITFTRKIFASFISEIKLFSFKGLTAKEEKSIRGFLSQFRIINIDEAIKEKAIALRESYSLKLPDSIIAATAISLQLNLITADKQYRQLERVLLELYEF